MVLLLQVWNRTSQLPWYPSASRPQALPIPVPPQKGAGKEALMEAWAVPAIPIPPLKAKVTGPFLVLAYRTVTLEGKRMAALLRVTV